MHTLTKIADAAGTTAAMEEPFLPATGTSRRDMRALIVGVVLGGMMSDFVFSNYFLKYGAKSKNDEVNPCSPAVDHFASFVNINFYCPASRTCSGNAFVIVATMSRVGSRHVASASH